MGDVPLRAGGHHPCSLLLAQPVLAAAGTDNGIRIWDLEGKGIVDELKLDLPVRDPKSKALPTSCISLAWSSDGNTLFAGYTDNLIRAWQVTAGQNTIF